MLKWAICHFLARYGGNPNLNNGSTNGTQTTRGKSSKKSTTGIIIGAVIGGTGALVIIILLCITGVCLCLRKKEKATDMQGHTNGDVSKMSHGNGTASEGAAAEADDAPTHATSYGVD